MEGRRNTVGCAQVRVKISAHASARPNLATPTCGPRPQLLDSVNVWLPLPQDFSAGEFFEEARPVAEDIIRVSGWLHKERLRESFIMQS